MLTELEPGAPVTLQIHGAGPLMYVPFTMEWAEELPSAFLAESVPAPLVLTEKR